MMVGAAPIQDVKSGDVEFCHAPHPSVEPQVNLQNYSAYYAGLPDGELAKIASSRGILVPEARRCLDAEITKRGLTAEDIKRFKNYRHSYHDPQSPIERKIRRSKLLGMVDQLRKIPPLRWRGILALILCTIPLVALFDYLGVLDLFMPVAGTAAVLSFTLYCHWGLKRRPWFWATIAIWTALHVWMIVRVHWPHKWIPARAWEGWVALDLVAIFVIIALIEKLLHEGPFAPRPRHAEN